MNKETKPLVLLLASWFCLALAGGVGRWFYNISAIGVALMVWTLTALVLVAIWKFQLLRAFALTIDLKWLIALHLTRFVGLYFLVLASAGELPSGFARPAGLGDVIIATFALLLVVIPAWRRAREFVLVWNVLGLIDILLVVFSALRYGRYDLDSMLPLRILPLCFLPAFLVPLIMATHVLIFVRLARSREE